MMEFLLPGFCGVLLGGFISYFFFQKKMYQKNLEINYFRTLLEQEKDKKVFMTKSQEDLENAFQGLSSKIFKNQHQEFLSTAQLTFERYFESAKSSFSEKQNAIDALLLPMKQTLAQVDLKMNEIEKERAVLHESLKEQIVSLLESQKDLRSETTTLSRALRAPSSRGRWGEMQLKRVVELSGMVNYCDYVEQKTLGDHDQRLRPDMIIHLPGKRNIIIDAKVPLMNYLAALEKTDDEQKSVMLKEHSKQIKTHIQTLSSKAYQNALDIDTSPDFVVLFLPGEMFFSAALEEDPTLIEYGIEKKVILATPTTLIALLKSVAYGWRQEQLSQNSLEISRLGQELYRKLLDMVGSFGKLGKHLSGTVQAYNQTVSELEGKVLTRAKDFQNLTGVEIERPFVEKIDHAVRPLTDFSDAKDKEKENVA